MEQTDYTISSKTRRSFHTQIILSLWGNVLDLHIHSNYSNDGEFSILEIMELCRKVQVD